VYETLKIAVMTLVLPPGGPLLMIGVGVLALRRYPRFGRAAALAGALSLWLCCLPVVAGALVTALGGSRPLDMTEAKTAEAIVILGGGVRPRAIEYGGDTLGRLTLERVRYGAFLARQTGLPILVTGGAPRPDVRAEAELMQEALKTEYGVDVRWVDSRSKDTRENAANTYLLLSSSGTYRVILVLHGFDVRRVRRNFEAAGLTVLPAPIQVPRWERVDLVDFLPSVGALWTAHFALYELLALLRDSVFATHAHGDR
jgi:uncharacterized SAM-binding protein YcdF (DUF218 family)